MGGRTYDPSLGIFASEDPVFGRMGIGASEGRYLYVWDNPLNYFDLNGRETCVATPLGSVCPVKEVEEVAGGAETAWHGIEEAGNGIGSSAEHAWNWTSPARHSIANRAQDFWKKYGSPIESAYKFAGENWESCAKGAVPGALIGGSAGSAFFGVGAVPGSIGGGVLGCGAVVGSNQLLKLGL